MSEGIGTGELPMLFLRGAVTEDKIQQIVEKAGVDKPTKVTRKASLFL